MPNLKVILAVSILFVFFQNCTGVKFDTSPASIQSSVGIPDDSPIENPELPQIPENPEPDDDMGPIVDEPTPPKPVDEPTPIQVSTCLSMAQLLLASKGVDTRQLNSLATAMGIVFPDGSELTPGTYAQTKLAQQSQAGVVVLAQKDLSSVKDFKDVNLVIVGEGSIKSLSHVSGNIVLCGMNVESITSSSGNLISINGQLPKDADFDGFVIPLNLSIDQIPTNLLGKTTKNPMP